MDGVGGWDIGCVVTGSTKGSTWGGTWGSAGSTTMCPIPCCLTFGKDLHKKEVSPTFVVEHLHLLMALM